MEQQNVEVKVQEEQEIKIEITNCSANVNGTFQIC